MSLLPGAVVAEWRIGKGGNGYHSMDFSIALVSRNRLYTRAYRRVIPDIQARINQLESVALQCPIGDTVLIMACDEEDIAPGELREMPGKDAVFQYAVGIQAYVDDATLRQDLVLILKQVCEKVPFVMPDHEQYQRIFWSWEGYEN
ncbi:hypothetical protein [Corticimicrobacter populi]|uniref:hypothetical protein n=1 Tax=Corticimicrobacter populi TaxID=2175229 RepID=UPI00195C3FD5|nr:hypothetical protein [Corticimicrobacter populi]